MNNLALLETAKTIGRGLWFLLLGVVVLVLSVIVSSPEVAAATIQVPVLNFPISVGTLIVAGSAGLIKIIDRYRHKSSNTTSNGLAPTFLQK